MSQRLQALFAGLNIDCEIWTAGEAGHVAVAVVCMSPNETVGFCVIHNQDHHDPVPRAERDYVWFAEFRDASKLAQDLFDGFTMTPAEIKARRQMKKAVKLAETKADKVALKHPDSVQNHFNVLPSWHFDKKLRTIHPEDARLMDSMVPNMAFMNKPSAHHA